MNIAINIDSLLTDTGQVKSSLTGIEQYVDSLFRSLLCQAPGHHFTAVAPTLRSVSLLHQAAVPDGPFAWSQYPNAHIDTAGNEFTLAGLRVGPFRPVARFLDWRVVTPAKFVTRFARTRRATRKYDLVHLASPSFVGLENFRTPRSVGTIYDVTTITYRWTHDAGNIASWANFFENARHRFNRVITISESAKAEIIEHLGISADRIDVTPLAPRASTQRVTDPELIQQARQIIDLQDRPFVLYAGTLEPRKNLARLVKAFARLLRESHGALDDLVLVLAGGNWNRHDLELRLLALEEGIGGRIITTGYISNDVMNALMSGCEAFVYVSLSEGFGLPPLEAMVCGAPVVSSALSSMPEVVGDAGLLVKPTDIEAIAQALHCLVTNRDENQKRRALSLARAKEFTWERTAALTLRSYEAALS